ncbi:MAG TPA: peptide-methionine (S)-S-oxide reductase MsrA [Stellaceae bacterium]|nr:peptide-methionine (S)-S-oxide reductase MsrA [Stellaceae bacterium]
MRKSIIGIAALCALALGAAWPALSGAAEAPHIVPPPALDEKNTAASETAVLAGGCFWGVQGVFQHVKGVTRAVSGYAGGDKEHAIYDVVSSGATGHAESVQVTFDPRQISFGEVLRIYFSVAHDPTELNRQGPDHGTQYRSTIFAQNAEQAKVAKAYIAQLDTAKVFDAPVVTTIETGKEFFPAEGYHQDFLETHQDYPYIVYNDLPKIANLKTMFPAEYRDKPVLVMANASNATN